MLQFVNFSITEINSNSVLKLQHNEIVIEILSYTIQMVFILNNTW